MEKCWAHKLNNCDGGISREHLISKSILEDVVRISGMFWCNGEEKSIGISSFVGKFLCRRHNSELSKLDEQILSFTNAFNKFDAASSKMTKYGFSIKKIPLKYNINGLLLEKWFCKTLINLSLANQKEIFIDFEQLLPFVFGNDRFQKPYGLNFAARPGQQVENNTLVALTPLINITKNKTKELGGGLFICKGFYFIFLIPCSKYPLKDGKLILNFSPNDTNNWDNLQLNWHNEEINQEMKKGKNKYTVQRIKFTW